MGADPLDMGCGDRVRLGVGFQHWLPIQGCPVVTGRLRGGK